MAKLKVKKINKKQQGGGIFGNLLNGFSFQDLQQGVGNQYGLGELLSQFQQDNPDFDITGQGSGLAGGMLGLLNINEDSKNSAQTAFNNRLTTPNYLSQFTAAPNLGMNTGYAQEGGGIPIDNTRVNTPVQQFNPQAAQQFDQQLYDESLNPAIAAYAEKAGKSYDEVKLWLDATAEHESFSGKKLKSTNKNKSVDTGIYHFNSASKPLIGKKTRVFLEELGVDVPNEVIQLEQGKDVNINSLPKDLQDIMALAHTTKHNSKGEISSYGLSKYDLTSRDGLAEAWVNEHNKGTAKDSLTNAYMNSLDRFGFTGFESEGVAKGQLGGKVNDQQGYLKSNLKNYTPVKVIQGSGGQTNITTKDMAFPIYANGQRLEPNSGDYRFQGNQVTEIPVESYMSSKTDCPEGYKPMYLEETDQWVCVIEEDVEIKDTKKKEVKKKSTKKKSTKKKDDVTPIPTETSQYYYPTRPIIQQSQRMRTVDPFISTVPQKTQQQAYYEQALRKLLEEEKGLTTSGGVRVYSPDKYQDKGIVQDNTRVNTPMQSFNPSLFRGVDEEGFPQASAQALNAETMERGYGPLYNEDGTIRAILGAQGTINPVDDPITMGAAGSLKVVGKNISKAAKSIYKTPDHTKGTKQQMFGLFRRDPEDIYSYIEDPIEREILIDRQRRINLLDDAIMGGGLAGAEYIQNQQNQNNVKQQGGYTQSPFYYKFGGIIGTTFNNNSSIPESEYGYITNGTLIGSFPNGTPIQTEDVNGTAEQIIFQNGAIANVNADTSHSRMTKNGDGDMVTDILPEGSYITSAYGGIKIKKKEVEDFKKIKTYPYAENMKGKAPEEYTFASEYFKKNEKTLTPAELSARVQKKYPVRDKVDIFGSTTNDINRSNRMPDLQVIIGKSEEAKQLKEEARLKRKVKRLVNELEDQGMLIDGDIQFAQNGGSVLKYRKGGKVEMRNVRKAQVGAILQGVGEIGQLISGIIKNQKLKKSALTQQGMNAANLAKYQDLLGELTPQLYDRVGAGRDANALGIAGNLGSSLAGILGQNRVSAKPQFFSSFNDINSQIDLGGQNALRGFRNTLGAQNNYNSILNATGDPNQAARVSNAGLAQSSNLANSIYANTSAQKIANLQNRTNELRDYDSRITALRNQDIGNFNKGISDVGNAFGSAFSATGQNELSRNQELGKVDLFDFSTNRALDTDFMNRYAGIESFRLGAPNPFAGVNFNTIGNAADSIFGNTNANAATGDAFGSANNLAYDASGNLLNGNHYGEIWKNGISLGPQ